MTNWCVVILAAFVYLAFYGSATWIKCYKCSEATESACTTEQNITDCNYTCAIVQLQLTVRGNHSHKYLKNCLPPSASCSRFLNSSLFSNCSMSRCSRSYCNGPTPTTPEVTKVTSTSPSEPESTTEKTNTSPNKSARGAGRVSCGASGLIVCLLVFTKTLERLTVS